MHKTPAAILTVLAAAALATAGCSKPEGDGHTAADETTYESAGSEHASEGTGTEDDDLDDPHGESGTSEIDDSGDEDPAMSY